MCDQLNGTFEAERAALADPVAAQRVIDELNFTKSRVEALRTAAARWNQTLNDGVTDLNTDIDHDLRERIREVILEADDAVDEIDPADTWGQMEDWLRARISYELLANYTFLRRARHDAERAGRRPLPRGVGHEPRASSRSTTPRRWSPTSRSSTRSSWTR